MAGKPKVQSAVEIAAEFRGELARLDAAAVESMLGAWGGVEEALLADMERFAARFEAGEVLTQGQVLRMERFRALYAQVEEQLALMERAAAGTIGAGSRQAAALGAAQAVGQLESLGVSVGFDRLPAAAVENVVSLARAGRPLAQLLEPMYGQAANGIVRELVNGVALGQGPRAIARRMARDGMTDGLNHLLLVTRDQYNRAHRSAALQTYRESGVVTGYVRRCARQVGRTCLACIALDGYFYKLESEFEGHPQDRCTMIPAVRGVDMKPLGGGKEWFKGLSKEEQIAVMGPVRWEQWQSGELQWHQMVQRRKHPVWGTSVTTRPAGYQRKTLGARKKKAPPPPPPPEIEDVFPAGVDGLERVRGLGGSTGAQLVRDPRTGELYVMKRGANAEHVRREFTADEMYRALGANVPEARLYETAGGPVKLSRFVEGKTLRELRDSKALSPATLRELQDGFAADVLMGNRDVIGTDFDNILIDRDGHPWRIDNGGSLDFRAQGGAKTYDRWPMEMWSMRDSAINRQTADIFGGMNYADLMESTRRTVQNGGLAADLLPAHLREAYAGRLEQMGEAVRQYDEMRAGGWRSEYVDGFTRFGFRMEQEGLFDRLPRQLEVRGTEAYDEQGRLFDTLRGHGSVIGHVADFVNANGGDYGMVSYYLRSQAGSSWSSGARAVKAFIYQNMDVDDNDVWWQDGHQESLRQYQTTVGRFGEEKFRNTWQAFHAFNYGFLKRVDFATNDRGAGTVQAYRTESESVMKRFKLRRGSTGVRMARGLAESSSMFEPVSVYGSELTVQQVPHARVWVMYLYERSPGYGGGALMSDHENELVFIPAGVRFDYRGQR